MVRPKIRYILFEIILEKGKRISYDSKKVMQTVKEAIHTNYGDFGLAAVQINLTMKYCNPDTNLCILRCPRDYYRMVWSSLTLITVFNSHPVTINVIHVGGTLKLCKTAALDYDREILMVEADEQDEGFIKV